MFLQPIATVSGIYLKIHRRCKLQCGRVPGKDTKKLFSTLVAIFSSSPLSTATTLTQKKASPAAGAAENRGVKKVLCEPALIYLSI